MLLGTIAGLCLLSTTLLPGCSYLESLSGLFSNVKFSAKPVRAIAPPYDFRIGDVYRYRVGDLFSEEEVTHLAGPKKFTWARRHLKQSAPQWKRQDRSTRLWSASSSRSGFPELAARHPPRRTCFHNQ